MPLVSVIILNWNRKEEIIKTLSDLNQQSLHDYEIIVVDQNSDDGSPDMITRDFPLVKLIRLHKNFGVPGGRNIGAANAKGDILVFLDNDASLDNSALESVVARFKNNPSLGIMGFKILNANTNELDFSSWVYQKSKIKESNSEFSTYTFCGAGHAIRREVFEKVGYYWDELFFGWEEMELSLKAMDKGYNIIYYSEIKVYHRISNQNRTVSYKHECFRLRNSLWVIWKYYPLLSIIAESVQYIFAYLFKAIKNRFFLQYCIFLLKGFSKLGFIFNKKMRISYETFKKYKTLSYKGSLFNIIKFLIKS